MKIGVMGGTFDPIHLGHLRAAEEVRVSFGLEKVVMVPVNIPPHKRDFKISSAEDRLNMVRMAITGNEAFEVSDVEIQRGGISYTLDTVFEFKKNYGEVYYLIGVDAFHEIDTWYMYEELFYHTNFIVMARPSKRTFLGLESFPLKVREKMVDLGENTYRHVSSNMTYVIWVTQLDISSSKIREYVKKGISIKYLVPPQVEEYIKERGLYKE
ncbi:MAG: nicotinate-nucleotide adenylyltransferase [Desulfobacterota bacterium]|nr:nicotinate-nucleotide adenylyltransferase [Thermodesulfobacteriota bacterium]MDW8002187.1 nicotinate-nucleotide adenylyltransferase [Deltaproteobacteria bacterium]